MTAGPHLRDLRLGKRTALRRRMVRIQRHQGKGSRLMYWCGHCERYSYDLSTHVCGERRS